LGDYESAIYDYENIVQRNQAGTPILLHLAVMYLELGGYDRSEDYLKLITKQSPDSSEAWYLYAQLSVAKGKNRRAKKQLKQAIKLDPKFEDLAKVDNLLWKISQ
jgi:tetratricopeptide (TPR) repeat protein